jgi:transcription antitermination factor NusG
MLDSRQASAVSVAEGGGFETLTFANDGPALGMANGLELEKNLELSKPEESAGSALGLPWFVAHTRPRCEKRLLEYCEREGFSAALPCYRAAHKYRGKTVVFQKPLFPGYLFVRLANGGRGAVFRSDYLANLLEVPDQALFTQQLEAVLAALETDCEIRLEPRIGEGMRVKIKNGPLRGMEAWVEKRHGMNTVLLRLDFIGQAAAVKLEATDLETI